MADFRLVPVFLRTPDNATHWSGGGTSSQNTGWYIFDISESEYDNQIALSHTTLKGKVIKLKNDICNKQCVGY